MGLRDPRTPSQRSGAVSLQGSAVGASTGDYERYLVRRGQRQHHLPNPRTGWPTTGGHGVSLLGSSVADVNGLGASIMVMGADAGKALAHMQGGLAVLIAQSNGQVWKSPAMARQLGAA